jgi:DNA polymerase
MKRYLKLEALFGADFLPASKSTPAKSAAAPPKTPPKPARASLVPIVGPVQLPPALAKLKTEIEACTRCEKLCRSRTQTVFGVGPLDAPIVFVGEAPGEDEDMHGEPFVGRAGLLLTETLARVGANRSRVYIANILKCRPPGNRTPEAPEMANCVGFLHRQLDAIKPRLIVLMGNVALKGLLNSPKGITSVRGAFTHYMGYKVLPTFHPAYVLRNMSALPTFEADLKLACRDAGLLA